VWIRPRSTLPNGAPGIDIILGQRVSPLNFPSSHESVPGTDQSVILRTAVDLSFHGIFGDHVKFGQVHTSHLSVPNGLKWHTPHFAVLEVVHRTPQVDLHLVVGG
jgi:hypothetical protein